MVTETRLEPGIDYLLRCGVSIDATGCRKSAPRRSEMPVDFVVEDATACALADDLMVNNALRWSSNANMCPVCSAILDGVLHLILLHIVILLLSGTYAQKRLNICPQRTF